MTIGLYTPSRMLVALSRINQTISRVRNDVDQLLHDTAGAIYDELGYDVVWVGQMRQDGEVVRAACQGMQPAALDATAPPVPLVTQVLQAAQERRPRLAHSAELGLDRLARASGPAALLTTTLGQNLVFALIVVRSAGQTFAGEEVSLLQEIASDVGFALDAVEAEKRTRMAEEALRTSEDRFRRLAEHATVGIVLIQNDLYRYVNPAFAHMFGYDAPRDIIDRLGPLDLTAPESRSLVAGAVEKRILGQIRSASLQYRGLRRDGRSFDVEEHGARTVHAQRLAVIATILDVTEREASRRRLEALAAAGLALSVAQTPQQALDVAAEQLRAILPCDTACVYLVGDGTVQAGARSSSADTSSALAGLLDASSRLDDIACLQRTIKTGDTVVTNTVDLSPGGALRSYAGAPLVVRGDMIGIACAEALAPDRFTEADGRHVRLFADHVAATLQHLRLVSSLEAERNRLRALNTLSHTLAETLDIQEVATRALAQIGDVLSSSAGLLFLWDETAGALAVTGAEGISTESSSLIARQLAKAGPGLAAAILDWHRDGAIRRGPHWDYLDQLGCETTRVLDLPLEAHGELVGILSFVSAGPKEFDPGDAALAVALAPPVALALQNARFYERTAGQARAMAAALRRQEELDRMKDELIQNVSHELRTPLALVMGYAEMLASGQLGDMTAEQAEAMGVIVRRSRMLRSLVEDIALLWHIERRLEDVERLNLTETVTTAATDFGAHASAKGVTIAADTPSGEVWIHGIPLHVRRVLDNLIGNALKFTPTGGRIQIRLTADDGWATLLISDTGIGVPAEHLEKIFDRFYQVDGSAKRRYGGTGLGLALARAIVERHQGTIHAESPIYDDPQHPGTRIVVRLPLCEATNEAPALDELASA